MKSLQFAGRTSTFPPSAVKPWQEATVHVMAHGLHYGSSVFEGIRSYDTPNGAKIFRLTDHLKRLYASAKIYDMPIPYTLEELTKASRDVIAKIEGSYHGHHDTVMFSVVPNADAMG